MEVSDKLLPCPFCWSSASLETGVTANIGGEEIQYVTCVECSAQADPYDWQTRPEAPAPEKHVELREAAWSLVKDLDRSLVGSRDIAVIHATNTSVKRLRILLEKLDRETPPPQPRGAAQ